VIQGTSVADPVNADSGICSLSGGSRRLNPAPVPSDLCGSAPTMKVAKPAGCNGHHKHADFG
jgi:hypothetical protein